MSEDRQSTAVSAPCSFIIIIIINVYFVHRNKYIKHTNKIAEQDSKALIIVL